jgi:hypothetical protein
MDDYAKLLLEEGYILTHGGTRMFLLWLEIAKTQFRKITAVERDITCLVWTKCIFHFREIYTSLNHIYRLIFGTEANVKYRMVLKKNTSHLWSRFLNK